MDIETNIKNQIQEVLKSLAVPEVCVALEHPADSINGDFATNIALSLAKQTKSNPRDLAEKIVKALKTKPIEFVEKIEIAGPGFINFYLSKNFFTEQLEIILKRGELYGNSNEWRGQKVLVEYTDPNSFKEFHIGHLMSNAIGESIARLISSQGAKVRRMCYQSDIGLNVAQAVWAMNQHPELLPLKKSSLSEKASYLGKCYAEGATAYITDEKAKTEIEELNKKLDEGSDRKLMKIYKLGRKWSLQKFDEIYEILGTKFDYQVLESEVIHDGIAIVEEFLTKGIFEKSDGAVIFKGEKYDSKLHTRVFINSLGLPTYEAKDLGLNTRKWRKIRPDRSIIITGNEQLDYFRVVMKALELVAPEAAKATEHIAHGFLRLTTGKMSSRTGKVITGESLIKDVESLVFEKLKDRDMDEKEKIKTAEIIAVAAIKYSILKQVTSSDIIYDFDKSISFEGDSGPYLLYTAVRAKSVLEKAGTEKIKSKITKITEISPLIRHLSRFPEVVTRSAGEKAPHFVATYLIELSSMFNAWYANTKIVEKKDTESPQKIAITKAVYIVLENGLKLLGTKVPRKM